MTDLKAATARPVVVPPVDDEELAAGRASRPRGRRRLGPGRPIRLGFLIGPLLLLGVWIWGSAAGWIDPRVLTAPWTVAATAWDLWESGRLGPDLLVSARRFALGLAFGVAAGLVLALVSGLSRWGEAIVDGPVQIKRSIPNLALLPLLLLWFGIDERMKIITIALGVLIPIYIHTHNGLRSIDGRYAELAETLRLRPAAFVGRVVLPGALPGFLLGMRFAVTSSWLSLVVVEQVNATSGIGYMMLLAGTYGQTDVIIVGLVLYALLGLASDSIVRLVQRRALSWRRTLED
nr:ABC transporter permease [Glycomyces albidus]